MLLKIILVSFVYITITETSVENSAISNRSKLVFYEESDGQYYIEDEVIPVLWQGSVANKEPIKKLRLYADNIKKIEPGAFQNLPNLEVLDIYENEIEVIETGIFNDLAVSRLELGFNAIKLIDPHAFDNMTKLNFLNLDNNKLNKWDVNWFAKTPSLRTIHLSYNFFQEIPAFAVGGSAETSFGDELFSIYLEGNKIKRIDVDAFKKNLHRIKVLSLSVNRIDSLDGEFLSGIQISELYLNDNKIQCLSERDFDKIFVSELTQIIDNPLNTTCLDKIKEWNATHPQIVQTYI